MQEEDGDKDKRREQQGNVRSRNGDFAADFEGYQLMTTIVIAV